MTTPPLITALLALALPGCATVAAPMPRAVDAACGRPVPITPGLVRNIRHFATAPLAGDDAVLVGEIRGEGSVIAFIRRDGGWDARLIAGDAAIERVARAAGDGPGAGDLFVWAGHGAGAPPIGFTGLFVPASGGAGFCTGLAAPAAPAQRGGTLALLHFNIAASGHGGAIAIATASRDDRAAGRAFRYRTRDGGRHWSRPESVAVARPVPGRFRTIEARSDGLMADLRARADKTLIGGAAAERTGGGPAGGAR